MSLSLSLSLSLFRNLGGTTLSLSQTIQNNLERAEFETKSRLGGKIEALEREAAVLKQRLTSEEERRARMVDAYEMQVTAKLYFIFARCVGFGQTCFRVALLECTCTCTCIVYLGFRAQTSLRTL